MKNLIKSSTPPINNMFQDTTNNQRYFAINRTTLLERLELMNASKHSFSTRIIPIEILFDNVAWSNPPEKIQVGTLYDKDHPDFHPPEEVFKRLHEMYETPQPYFCLTPQQINKVKFSKKFIFTPEQLQELFEKEHLLSLGQFTSLGEENNIFTQMNNWYYGAMGKKAFTTGKVPTVLTSHPLIQKTNAQLLYNSIIQSTNKSKSIPIVRLGSGGNFEPVINFLNRIQELDTTHNTQVYQRLTYTVSDLSKKSINRARKESKKDSSAAKHCKERRLRFDVLDAIHPKVKDAANVESSYLYDSISQPIIAKVNGIFYEVKYRGIIDSNKSHEIRSTNQSNSYPSKLFKEWLCNDDFDKLSDLTSKSFDAIDFERKFVRIPDMTNFPYGNLIREMLAEHDNVTLPIPTTHIRSIEEIMNQLQPGGFFQTFDLGITHSEDILKNQGEFRRLHGALYKGVNFLLIAKIMQEKGYKVTLEHITDYLERMNNTQIIYTGCLWDAARCDKNFDFVFPTKFLKGLNIIKRKARKLKKKYGYSDQGRKHFVSALIEKELLPWDCGEWSINDEKRKDYLTDLKSNLKSTLVCAGNYDNPTWIIQNQPDSRVDELIDYYGFTPEIKDHWFSIRDHLKKSLDYHHLCIEKR